MSYGLPALYRRGTDIFGCKKVTQARVPPNSITPVNLPPLPSINDLLILGRDEIAHMKELKNSLKIINKCDLKDTAAPRHHAPPPTAPDFSAYEDLSNDSEGIDTDSESEIDDEEEMELEDEIIEDSLDRQWEDIISSLFDYDSSNDLFPVSSSNSNNGSNNACGSSRSGSARRIPNDGERNIFENALLNQPDSNNYSNVHIDDALSFVSSMVCRGAPTSSNYSSNSNSTSNSSSVVSSPLSSSTISRVSSSCGSRQNDIPNPTGGQTQAVDQGEGRTPLNHESNHDQSRNRNSRTRLPPTTIEVRPPQVPSPTASGRRRRLVDPSHA
ncbi:hypothetical protein TRFO_20196 [Tritrichomonas foetus]|uniref:Uncharacterized protein n=1 Tax=Tritrichomonas foetus TaxID=1144522 RepID=A0A1J4KGC9_9EUKA|nr:hypothetical protein TRFO_20196 [Tritrichomonas foetus]|eukprot:OHT10463.1 hypothetical protein TRFO_20196 [Tritrichomonas foetus]